MVFPAAAAALYVSQGKLLQCFTLKLPSPTQTNEGESRWCGEPPSGSPPSITSQVSSVVTRSAGSILFSVFQFITSLPQRGFKDLICCNCFCVSSSADRATQSHDHFLFHSCTKIFKMKTGLKLLYGNVDLRLQTCDDLVNVVQGSGRIFLNKLSVCSLETQLQ